MTEIKGKGIYGGVAVGVIRYLEKGEVKVRREHSDDSEHEIARFENAKAEAVAMLDELFRKAVKEVGEPGAQIFEIHKMMADDEDYNDSIKNIIRSQQVNAEYAVAQTSDNFALMFSSMDDDYMQARAADVRDVSDRILRCLTERGETGASEPEADGKYIICADDLTPGETVMLDKEKVIAFITAHGSANSHTAILARTMNIPAVIGLGEKLLDPRFDGVCAAVDGFTGTVYIDPDESVMKAMAAKRDEELRKKSLLAELKGKENITLDGRKIKVYANIGGLSDIGAALVNDADGIGLFRSEFLYLESSTYPTEEEQFAVYRRVLESMGGKKVIIRTMDIGADKQIGYFDLEHEENPAMGFRAIRICLAREDIFRTQLKALFRASAYGSLGIMFPMIISEKEVVRIKEIIGEVKKELDEAAVPYSKSVEIGIMIETPAAAVISDILAPHVDFFSVGTNDLSQYTMAIDRQNPNLDSFFDPHHEAVLRLIELACKNAHAHGKWIGICGELGADTELTKRFLQMGIDELSVSPPSVLVLRKTIRETDLSKDK
ncbi:MAG: phosphoenolpyruvate--protein phosphotransferase [Huintestinicola sp.]